jgi:hypothetical protein
MLFATRPLDADAGGEVLKKLLADPEANEHEHVFSKEGRREISVSVITSAKLRNLDRYSKAERAMFEEG